MIEIKMAETDAREHTHRHTHSKLKDRSLFTELMKVALATN